LIAKLFGNVRDDAVVRGRGGREHGHARVQRSKDPADPPIVRPKVVSPVGDAVRLVDHEQADRALDPRKDLRHERLVCEALG
jgi:hypothetical protein